MTTNITAERSLLSCMCKDSDTFFALADYLSDEDFTHAANKQIFACLRRLFIDEGLTKVAKNKILVAAKDLNFQNFESVTNNLEILDKILAAPIDAKEFQLYFKSVKGFTLKRQYQSTIEEQTQYLKNTADSPLSIIQNIESAICNVGTGFKSEESGPVKLCQDIEQHINELADNPGHVGIELGLPIWQHKVGQCRNGAITFVVGTAKCLSGDTDIYNAEDGTWQRMKDIIKSRSLKKVSTFDIDNQEMTTGNIIDYIDNNVRKVYELTTHLGHKIICTPNHPFLTEFGWRQLSELKSGDHIAVPRRIVEPTKPRNIFSQDECYLLGVLFGDGGLSCNSVTFTNADSSVVKATEVACTKLGIKFIDYEYKPYGYGLNKNVWPILEKSGLRFKKSKQKTVHDNIFSLSNERLAHFLGGIWDTDGSISGPNNTFLDISVTLSSKQAILDIQKLLLRFGVVSKYKFRYTTCNGKCFKSWRLTLISRKSIYNFLDIVECMHHDDKIGNYHLFIKRVKNLYEKSNLDTLCASHMQSIIKEESYRHNHLPCNKRDGVLSHWTTHPRVSRWLVGKIADKLQSDELSNIANSDCYYDKIISIRAIGRERVYDIEVAQHHNFVANNIICHNSGKTQFALRAALHVAQKLNLPVFYADSELNQQIQQIRLAGMMSAVPYDIIESGFWKLTPEQLKKKGIGDERIDEIIEYGYRLKNPELWSRIKNDILPLIEYCPIYGTPVTEVIPQIKRWLVRTVKPDPNNKSPQCLIVYDYIKLATIDELKSGRIAEWQMHGIHVASLHDFAQRHNVPVLAFGQTNNEQIDSPRCIAGGKRIIENVDSATIIKKKDADEIVSDNQGSHYMNVFLSRFGEGTGMGHINMDVDLSIGSFKELGYSNINFVQAKQKRIEKARDDHDHV